MEGAILLLALYFAPTIVALARSVPHSGSVAIINTFLGWTLVGWVVALAMAARSVPNPPAPPPPSQPSQGGGGARNSPPAEKKETPPPPEKVVTVGPADDLGAKISRFTHSNPWITVGVAAFLAFLVGLGAGFVASPDEQSPVVEEAQVVAGEDELQEEADRLAELAAELDAREQEIGDIERTRDRLEAREQRLEREERQFARRVRRAERNRIEEGMWEVGRDTRPGTYRSPQGVDCYWARRSDATGDFGTIIANGSGLNQTVTLQGGEWFETTCGPWERL